MVTCGLGQASFEDDLDGVESGFQRLAQRLRLVPVGSRPTTARQTHLSAACSFAKCPKARAAPADAGVD